MEKLGVDGWRESEEIFGSECPYDFCCLQPSSMAITFIIYTQEWGHLGRDGIGIRSSFEAASATASCKCKSRPSGGLDRDPEFNYGAYRRILGI